MKMMFCVIKLFLERLVMQMLYFIPPRKNQVFFFNFVGHKFSDNPKYIFLELYKQYGEKLQYVWYRLDQDTLPDEYKKVIRIVKRRSIQFVWAFAHSKVVVTNNELVPWLPFSKGKRTYINTWHGGGAYKKANINVREVLKLHNALSIICSIPRETKSTDYFLSSNKEFSKIMNMERLVDYGKFLNCGMPRNDLFFDTKKMSSLRDIVREKFGIEEGKKIVLYAPTYRGGGSEVECPFVTKEFVKSLLIHLENKFGGKFILFYRCHYFYNESNDRDADEYLKKHIFDASDYPNMQELLCATDVFVTDYSSSMWDFSFTYKPGFLYVPDLESYIKEPGICTPIDTWPFDYSKTLQGLLDLIDRWDAGMQKEKCTGHHKRLGSFECGGATKEVVRKIANALGMTDAQGRER